MAVWGCEVLNPSYIGPTRYNIRTVTRLNQHRQNGAVIEHLASHNKIENLFLEAISSNVTLLQKLPADNKLFIHEALSILDRKPDLNKRIDNLIINHLNYSQEALRSLWLKAGRYLENLIPLFKLYKLFKLT